jgi:uncharacterized protein (DUF3820 family)
MPFGKYKGKCMGLVPGRYLVYLKKEGIAKGALLNYIVNNWPVLHKKDRY